MKRSFSIFLGILFTAISLLTAPAYTQSDAARLLVNEVESDETPFVHDGDYPALSLDVAPVNAAGVPVAGLTRADFSLRQDGVAVNGFELAAFINVEQPISLMVVVDISQAMRDTLATLKTAITNLYGILEQSDESGIIAFSLLADGTAVNLGEPFPQLHPNREMAFTNDEGALINLANGLTVEESAGAPLYDALLKGIRMTAAQARYERRAVVLMTAGSDVNRNGHAPGSNVANADIAINEAQQLAIPVFAIGIGDQDGSSFLQGAATSSGGRYYHVADAGQTNQALADVVAQLKQSYRLHYTSAQAPDDTIHSLTVAVQTTLGAAEATVEYKARYPVTPVAREVTVVRPGQEPLPLEALTAVKGVVTIQPDVVAREAITAVNYYIDGSQTAIFSARQAPWSFAWDTGRLAANQSHELLIEMIDDATPPHVGVYQTTLFVEACHLLCQIEQRFGFNPISVLVLTAGITGLLASLYMRRSSSQSSRLYGPEPRPRSPDALLPHLDAPLPRPGNVFIPFRQQPKALTPEEPETPAPAAPTEVLEYEPDSIAFLIDLKSGHEFRLRKKTTIGGDLDNHIVLDGAIAKRHAQIVLSGTEYVLTALTTVSSTKVNHTDVVRHVLADGDRVELGGRLLVFKQVK
jgi:Mg-chelatase subunit ChlD